MLIQIKKSVRYKKNLLLGIFFVFLFIQHKFVYLYYDDYGYASLSYGYSGNAAGMKYTFLEIIKFLIWHYFYWGGRVLYFFFGILSLRCGVWFVQLIQSVIIWGICFYSWKLISSENVRKSTLQLFLIIMFYGMIGLTTFNEGIFWYTASFIYVWPLLSLFLGIYLHEKALKSQDNQKNLILCSFLFFLSAFSQEQVGILTLVYVLLRYYFIYTEKKKISKVSVTVITAAFMGGILVIMAPGNFVRAANESNTAFNALSLMEKLMLNIPKVLDLSFGYHNKIFASMLFIIFICLSYMNLKRKENYNKLWTLNMVVSIVISTLAAVTWSGVIAEPLKSLILLIWILLFCINITLYLKEHRQMYLIAMLYAGICSQAMMVLSPTIPQRCYIPFAFILHITAAFVLTDFILKSNNSNGYVYWVGVMGVIALFNIYTITGGYYRNAEVHRINNCKLIEKSQRMKAGMNTDTIILYRLRDDRYASQMPYGQDHSFIESWWKQYYEIPQDVTFVWDYLVSAD